MPGTKRKAPDASAPSAAASAAAPLVIGITGASQSGKTTVTKLLAALLKRDGLNVEIVEQDRHRISNNPKLQVGGRVSWEGPELTNWADLEDKVLKPEKRPDVLLVEGYMLLDCTEAMREALSMLLWVESSVEICTSRRTSYPKRPRNGYKGWESAAAYVRGCIWPAHEAYERRCFPLIDWDVKGSENLKTAASAPVVFLPASESKEERASRAAECVRRWLAARASGA